MTRYRTYYTVLKTAVVSALGIPETPLSWTWEGMGLSGWLVARISDVTTVGNPIPGVTKVRERYAQYPMSQLKAQYFASIPDAKFEKLSVSFDSTRVIFNLNLEEDV